MEPVHFIIKNDVFEKTNFLVESVNKNQTEESIIELKKHLTMHYNYDLTNEQLGTLIGIYTDCETLKQNDKLKKIIDLVNQVRIKTPILALELLKNNQIRNLILESPSPFPTARSLSIINRETRNAISDSICVRINNNPQIGLETLEFNDINQVLNFLKMYGTRLSVLNTGKISVNQVDLHYIVQYCPNLEILRVGYFNPNINFDESEYRNDDGEDDEDMNLPACPIFAEVGEILSQLLKLKEITMNNMDIDDTFIFEIDSLNELEKINFNFANWGLGVVTSTGFESLCNHKNLKSLDITSDFHLDLKDLSGLSQLKELEHLTLSREAINTVEELQPIGALHQLKSLTLGGYEDYQNKLSYLLQLKQLEIIKFDEVDTDIGSYAFSILKQLESLKELIFKYTDIAEEGIIGLCTLTQLRKLSLGTIKPEAVRFIKSNLPQLEKFTYDLPDVNPS